MAAQPVGAEPPAIGSESVFLRRVMAEHVNSVVKIGVVKNIDGEEKNTYGTGFIVHMESKFSLIMTCGHVLSDHIPGSIVVHFGHIKIKGHIVFCRPELEVGCIRVNQSDDPEKFSRVAKYPAFRWSAREAPEKALVAILSRTTDPEKLICDSPSTHHGTVLAAPRFMLLTRKNVPLHIGTADYTSAKGNSGSPVVNTCLQVIGIHIRAADRNAQFVCLEGVARMMTEFLNSKSICIRSSGAVNLMDQIIESEGGTPSSGAGAGGSSSGSGAGASSSKGGS